MIIPYPENNLSLSIFVLGSEIIQLLKQEMNIDMLLMEFLKSDNRRSPELFMDTLTFLFAIGFIQIKGYKIKILKNDYTQTTLFGN